MIARAARWNRRRRRIAGAHGSPRQSEQATAKHEVHRMEINIGKLSWQVGTTLLALMCGAAIADGDFVTAQFAGACALFVWVFGLRALPPDIRS